MEKDIFFHLKCLKVKMTYYLFFMETISDRQPPRLRFRSQTPLMKPYRISSRPSFSRNDSRSYSRTRLSGYNQSSSRSAANSSRRMKKSNARKDAADKLDKTREIQKILTLDDPEEQVKRFLTLIRKKDEQMFSQVWLC